MRWPGRRALFLLTAALTVVVGGLLQAGRFLQHEDPLRHADALFVLGGAGAERTLEAYELHRAGYAPLIVLSPAKGNATPADLAARDRGIRFPSEAELIRDALIRAGLPQEAVIVAEGAVDNTAAEAEMLRRLATSRGWRTVIVVTSKFHTRRAGFAMRRALDGTGVGVVIRASRFDMTDPARWWRQRSEVRELIAEWPKLIAYRLGLGE